MPMMYWMSSEASVSGFVGSLGRLPSVFLTLWPAICGTYSWKKACKSAFEYESVDEDIRRHEEDDDDVVSR